MEEYLAEASKILDRARSLEPEERLALNYFIENISVGDLRAVKDLKALGVNAPEAVVRKLVSMGFIERGEGCYNLAKPLRNYVMRRGKIRV
ncbi:MAG: hypothetical protein P3X22_004685 [Thermoprotei archaeon]|nr:hypothetical protein [Thermoprotei archaeon]